MGPRSPRTIFDRGWAYSLGFRVVTHRAGETEASLDPLGKLFASKLSAPRFRQGVVSRADLIDKARSSGCRVVGITAPAGYGKTTLLAEWAEGEERAVAFVSIDRFDDDPARLTMTLASAFGQIPGADPDLAFDVSGPRAAVLARAAPRLSTALRTSPSPFVLMLDDLHQLTSAECHDVLGLVMSGVPEHSQLVAASRAPQPHLPRLRAAGEAMELGAPDLVINEAGAQQIFASHDLSLSSEHASLLTQRTEGWPVGINLAALIVRDGGNETLKITGEDPYVADYLYDEALAKLPDEVRAFLRRTAILEELSAPLCDSVLLQSGSSQVLRELEDARLFLVPLDRRRKWFRYHDLFREFLQYRLRSVEPELIPDLHLRAANWYESTGAPEKAVEHLLQTAETKRCAELISEVTMPMYQAGHMSTLTRWLTDLGEEGIKQYPPLAAIAGDVAILSGRTVEADRWLALVSEMSYEGAPRDGTASFESSRAFLRAMACAGGPEQMLADARFAVEQEPSWSVWRDSVLVTYAEAHLLKGNHDRARELFEETSRVAAEFGYTDNFAIAESELALLAIDRGGEWNEAKDHVERALAVIDEHRMQDYATAAIAFAAGARVSLQSGEMEETNRLLAKGMRARQFCTAAIPFLAVRTRLHLAKVHLALAETSAARHLLREISDILHERPRLGTLVDEVEKFREEVSSSNVRTPGRAPLTPAELRLLPYLQTHLTFPEIADRLFVSRNTVRTQVASIYRKLGAGSRAEAVDRATEIGLLGG